MELSWWSASSWTANCVDETRPRAEGEPFEGSPAMVSDKTVGLLPLCLHVMLKRVKYT